MNPIDKPFIDMHTMAEAMQAALFSAENRKMVNDTPANHAAATFMATTQWMLIDLSKAALENRLLERLIELQQEHEAIAKHLARSPKDTQ